MTTARWLSGMACVLLLLASSPRARAETSDAAAAEALFDEGRRLVQEGRYADACQKLEASQHLDPGVGTLLNLGDCLERAGRTASAWARFREAASLAVATSQREREQAARARAQALEERLVRLVIRASPANAELRVVRDGVVLEREAWGTAVPVDPGTHVLSASAPGKTTWSTELFVDGTKPGATHAVDVPRLADLPQGSFWTGQHTASAVTFGLGVAAAAVGTGLAIHASSAYDRANDRCTARGCSADARAEADAAGNAADIATGMFIGGAVALVAGVVLFVTAPRAAKELRAVGFSPVFMR